MRVRESCRIFAASFAAGFVFGCALNATLHDVWSADLRIGALWGVAFIVMIWLGDYMGWIFSQQNRMRKEEVQLIVKDLDREISDLKRKMVKPIQNGGEGDFVLIGIYIDRIIEIEKLKESIKSGSIHRSRIEDRAKLNKRQNHHKQ